MGVIKRQGIKQSLVTYVGVLLGIISILWIYPLSLEIYGLSQLLMAIALILFPFGTMGIAHLAVKFFPEFQKNDPKHGFLGFILSLQFLWSLVFVVLLYVFKDYLVKGLVLMNFNGELIEQHSLSIVLLCFLSIYIIILNQYTSNYNRIVVPAIFNNIWVKIALPVIVLLVYFNIIGESVFEWLWVGVYVVVFLGGLIYLRVLGHLELRFNYSLLTWDRVKRMWDYALFSTLSSLGTNVALRIDTVMVGLWLGLRETGIYSLMLFITSVIEIPYKSIKSISNPIISKSWETGDLDEIKKIYRKASQSLFFIGSLVFLMIWANLDVIFSLTGKPVELMEAKNVVLFLGIAKIVDMTLGVNTQILGMSKYYRFNMFALLILSSGNLLLNYLFIPIFKLPGVSLATLSSILLYNLMTFTFLYVKYKMTPFTSKTLLIAGMLTVSLAILFGFEMIFPVQSTAGIWLLIVNSALKTILILILYGVGLFYFGASDEIKHSALDILQKVLNRVKSA